jgi:hypothetical protein
MALNKHEKSKIESQVRLKLLNYKFEFDGLEVLEKSQDSIVLKFTGPSHPSYKNVRLMSYESYVKETPLYTYIYINLRFLHGKLQSPIVGYKITSFKLTIS